jgi:multimeric flavodoxin WrbA
MPTPAQPEPAQPLDHSGLRALFVSCTLTPSPGASNTEALMADSIAIMEQQGVSTELVRAVDLDLAPGIQPDLSEQFPGDEWPGLFAKVQAADILVLGSPIWLGEKSSVCTRVVERLYAHSAETNDRGQSMYYGKVGGVVVTGNEDGYKHIGMNLTYSLQHLGFTVPPQSDVGWVGEAGPGPSYADEGSGGPESDFTQRTLTFMTWNLLHMAATLRARGGIPAYGTSTTAWQDGERFGHPRGDAS